MAKMKTKLTTLRDLTGQESGIVIYHDGDIDRVIVCNWSQDCTRGGLPVEFYGALVAWADDYYVTAEKNVDDIRDEFRGVTIDADGDLSADCLDIVYDCNDDIPALWGVKVSARACVNTDNDGNYRPTGGKVYALTDNDDADITVIAPDGWH